MVAATIRTIFAQPTGADVRHQVTVVADMLQGQFPAVADLLRDATADLTAFADFPQAHWQKIWSTNPLERLNREVKRRTDVVGSFRTPPPCCGCPPACSSRRTTSGRTATALPVRGVDGPAHPTEADHPDTPKETHQQPLSPIRHRYGIVATTRRAQRHELHHPTGHNPKPCHDTNHDAARCSMYSTPRDATNGARAMLTWSVWTGREALSEMARCAPRSTSGRLLRVGSTDGTARMRHFSFRPFRLSPVEWCSSSR